MTARKEEKDRKAGGVRDGDGDRRGRDSASSCFGEGLAVHSVSLWPSGQGPSTFLFQPRAGKSCPSVPLEATCWPGSE